MFCNEILEVLCSGSEFEGGEGSRGKVLVDGGGGDVGGVALHSVVSGESVCGKQGDTVWRRVNNDRRRASFPT